MLNTTMNITVSPDRQVNATTVPPEEPVDNLPLIIGVSVGAGVALLLIIGICIGLLLIRSATAGKLNKMFLTGSLINLF